MEQTNLSRKHPHPHSATPTHTHDWYLPQVSCTGTKMVFEGLRSGVVSRLRHRFTPRGSRAGSHKPSPHPRSPTWRGRWSPSSACRTSAHGPSRYRRRSSLVLVFWGERPRFLLMECPSLPLNKEGPSRTLIPSLKKWVGTTRPRFRWFWPGGGILALCKICALFA